MDGIDPSEIEKPMCQVRNLGGSPGYVVIVQQGLEPGECRMIGRIAAASGFAHPLRERVGIKRILGGQGHGWLHDSRSSLC